MSKKPKVGDIVEIQTPNGLVYAQFTHKHKQYGALLRIFQGAYKERPERFDHIVEEPLQFETFFPLAAACNQGITQIVASIPVKESFLKFPVFRTRIKTPQGSGPWWLWDGESEWKITTLEEGMERLPLRGVINDTLLIERIVSGWRAEQET